CENSRLSILSNYRTRKNKMKRQIFKSLSVITATLIVATLVSCNTKEPDGAMPKVQPYQVFGFKEAEYVEHLWAINEAKYYGETYGRDTFVVWDAQDTRLRDYHLVGESMYLNLHGNLLIGNHTSMRLSAVILKQKEADFDINRWCYGYEDVLDFHPFSSFYCIPGKALGINDVYTQYGTSHSDLVPRINALIDSGDIEQYRVDLGY
ncbi:MAG: hypothetical protein J6Y77_08025, partial [Paludibacteraceae bacterium]|nr:hypothetical protein [Paludibacteraceae bacterium]